MFHKHVKAFLFMFAFILGAAAKASTCKQWTVVSIYNSNESSFFQESVGTTILWKDDNKKYLLATAHAVSQASLIIGICDNEARILQLQGLDENNDVALLTGPAVDEADPLLILPQLDLAHARLQLSLNGKPLRTSTPTEPDTWTHFKAKFNGEIPYQITRTHENLKDQQYRFPTLMHPFFKQGAIIRDQLPLDGGLNSWSADINSTLGTYTLNSSGLVEQFVYQSCLNKDDKKSKTCEPSPYLDLEAIKVELGIRPGMSGAPLFEWLGPDIDPTSLFLIGMVSKTRLFENTSLLIPATTIEQSIRQLVTKSATAMPLKSDWQIHYRLGSKNNLIQYIKDSATQQKFYNICDNDFRNTAEQKVNLKKIGEFVKHSQSLDLQLNNILLKHAPSAVKNLDSIRNLSSGGEHGEGGGSFVSDADYIFSPYFTSSVFAPASHCSRSGVIDTLGRHIIGIRTVSNDPNNTKVLPIRNLDQLIMAIRQHPNLQELQSLFVLESDRTQAFALAMNTFKTSSLAWHRTKANPLFSPVFDSSPRIMWMFPKSTPDGTQAQDGSKSNPSGAIFRDLVNEIPWSTAMSFASNLATIQFIRSESLKSPGAPDQNKLAIDFKADPQLATLDITIGKCAASGLRIRHDVFDFHFETEFGDFRISDLGNQWEIRGTKIHPNCGVSSNTGAFDILLSPDLQ